MVAADMKNFAVKDCYKIEVAGHEWAKDKDPT